MVKRVAKYSIKLFLIRRELNVVFKFLLNRRDNLKNGRNSHLKNFNILKKILMNLGFLFRTKLELAYIATQGIVNIDVIDRTKQRKLSYLSSKMEFLNSFIDLCVGYVCGMLTIENIKIETQPLNMVLSKN